MVSRPIKVTFFTITTLKVTDNQEAKQLKAKGRNLGIKYFVIHYNIVFFVK